MFSRLLLSVLFASIFKFCVILPSAPSEFLAAHVPEGLGLSPGEGLVVLAEVWVGLEGLYGLESPAPGRPGSGTPG